MDTEKIMAFDLFNNLTNEEVTEVLSLGRELAIEKGDRIIEESSPTFDLFVLLDGKVVVEFEITDYESDTSVTLQLVHLKAGDVIGEIAFLEKHNRTASVTAVEKTRIIKFDGGRLHELFGRNSLIGYLIMQNLALILIERLKRSNLEWLNEKLADH
jgi:CRP-like cAMP-binding protein